MLKSMEKITPPQKRGYASLLDQNTPGYGSSSEETSNSVGVDIEDGSSTFDLSQAFDLSQVVTVMEPETEVSSSRFWALSGPILCDPISTPFSPPTTTTGANVEASPERGTRWYQGKR
jgi:hypothetical protein